MIELDCTNLSCPMPVIKLKKALHENPEQVNFQISLKDKGGLRDIPAFCQQQGLQCKLVSEQPVISFTISRSSE